MEDGKTDYKRLSWDDYFIEIMEAISKRATCERGRSGCVIVKNKQVISAGYVGSAIGDDHCDEAGHLFQKRLNADGSTSMHCVRTVHAEQNAICQAAKNGTSVDGGTLYCRMTPCPVCAKMIVNCGIKRVVCQKKYHDGKEAERVFAMAGVALIHVSEDEQSYTNKGKTEQPKPEASDETEVKIKKMHPSAQIPQYSREGDAGFDLVAVEGASLKPGQRASLHTGLAFEIPTGFVGLIWDRSGLSHKKGLKSLGGVVDSSYRGEVMVGLLNTSSEPIELMKGDKIAQMIIQKFESVDFKLSEDLTPTERADNWAGSTDQKPIEKIINIENTDTLAKELKVESPAGNVGIKKEQDGKPKSSSRW